MFELTECKKEMQESDATKQKFPFLALTFALAYTLVHIFFLATTVSRLYPRISIGCRQQRYPQC